MFRLHAISKLILAGSTVGEEEAVLALYPRNSPKAILATLAALAQQQNHTISVEPHDNGNWPPSSIAANPSTQFRDSWKTERQHTRLTEDDFFPAIQRLLHPVRNLWPVIHRASRQLIRSYSKAQVGRLSRLIRLVTRLEDRTLWKASWSLERIASWRLSLLDCTPIRTGSIGPNGRGYPCTARFRAKLPHAPPTPS